jgi:hypothetical protein
MKKKWAVTIYILIGVLLPVPLIALTDYMKNMYSSSLYSATMFGYYYLFAWGYFASVIAAYVISGVYIGLHKRIKTFGVKGKTRVKRGEFALGAGFLALEVLLKISYLSGAFGPELVYNSPFLRAILSFNDSFFIWSALAGFFMADAFEKVPAIAETRAVGPGGEDAESEKVVQKDSVASPEAGPGDAGREA